MNNTVTISYAHDPVDWQRLADIFANAPFATRTPEDIQEAFANSYICCFAFSALHDRHDSTLLGAARAISDGVYYAVILDVVVDAGHQGQGIGRTLMEALLGKLPLEKIYLTAPPDAQNFYRKLGFYKHNNAMGRYAHPEKAFEHGVLSKQEPWSLAGISRYFTGSKPSNHQFFE